MTGGKLLTVIMHEESFLSEEERDALRVLLIKMGEVMARRRHELANTKNIQGLLELSAEEALDWLDNLRADRGEKEVKKSKSR